MADAARNQAYGGMTVYGACVGILMLETRSLRIPGDIGHAATWPLPVLCSPSAPRGRAGRV